MECEWNNDGGDNDLTASSSNSNSNKSSSFSTIPVRSILQGTDSKRQNRPGIHFLGAGGGGDGVINSDVPVIDW